MNAKWRLLIVAGLTVAAALVQEAPAIGQESRLQISSRLDAREYAVGEPVILMVSVINAGVAPFQDFAYMDPAAGWLSLNLLRHGAPAKWTGYRDDVGTLEGPTLLPGEEYCAVIDLGEWFGEDVVAAGTVGAVRVHGLREGRYSIAVRLNARTGEVPSLKQVTLSSEEATFTVRKGLDSDSDRRAADMLDHFSRSGTLPVSTGLAAIRSYAGSRHILQLIRAAKLRESDMSTFDLAQTLERSGAGQAVVARVVNRRIAELRLGDRKKREYVMSLSKKLRGRDAQCILDTWTIKLRSNRWFYSFGP